MKNEAVHIQCVYGDKHIENIENVLIPSLLDATKRDIYLSLYKYDNNINCVSERKNGRLRVISIGNKEGVAKGFAENHNYLFETTTPSDFFIILNPDTFLSNNSIDELISTKLSNLNAAIVEGRQWPFEHPKEYDPVTKETPWASGCYCLIDSEFYKKIGGMDVNYFLYDEDVDLSWQAWLNGYTVLYEPKATVAHFTDGPFVPYGIESSEGYFEARNFIPLMYKFFGDSGENRAKEILKRCKPFEFAECCSYFDKIKHSIDRKYHGKHDIHVKVLSYNCFAEIRK